MCDARPNLPANVVSMSRSSPVSACCRRGQNPPKWLFARWSHRLGGKTRLTRDRSPELTALALFSYFSGTDELPRPSEPFAYAFRSPARCSERRDQLRKHQKLRGTCSKGLLWPFGTPTGDALDGVEPRGYKFTTAVYQRAVSPMPASHRKIGAEFSKIWPYQTI